MKCILLCAGYATRLYPLTQNQPKALLAVGDKTILDHIMEKVEEVEEVKDVYVVTNNKFYEHFNSWKGSLKTSKEVHIVNDGTMTNEDRLGAVGDINYVLERFEIKDDLLVIAGDNLFRFSLKDMVSFGKNKQASVLATYDMKEKEKVANKFGVVISDEEGKVTDFEEKPAEPKATTIGTACYFFKAQDVAKIKEYVALGRTDNPGDFVKWLNDSSQVYSYTFEGGWFDIGSFEQLEEAYDAYGHKR